jgi:hypothetical protein
VTARRLEHPVADVLRVLAVSRSSGALEVRGLLSGTFFLNAGDITYAEASSVPLVEEVDVTDPQALSMIRSSIVEAGLTLLAPESAEGERPLFRPGRRHWSSGVIRIEVESLLAEIAQQEQVIAGLGIEADDEVQLCGLPAGRSVGFSRRQWDVATKVHGRQTGRSLARASALPLATVIENLAALLALGVVERAAPVAVPPPWPPPSTSPLPPEAPPAQLPHRVPGSTPVPDARAGMPAEWASDASDAHELALRLLAGLRRL